MSALSVRQKLSASPNSHLRRTAAILAVVVGFIAIAVAFAGGYAGRANSPLVGIQVLRASRAIAAGTVIESRDLESTQLATSDASTLATLVRRDDQGSIVGKIAAVSVPAGSLIPSYIAAEGASPGLWTISIPARSKPLSLSAHDHVALMVAPLDTVLVQDVEVAAVSGTSVELFLPARLVSQVQWYSDHGGIAVVKMPAGDIVKIIPPGGPPAG